VETLTALDAAMMIGLSGVALGAYEVVPPRWIIPRELSLMPVRNEADVLSGPIGMEGTPMTSPSCRRAVLAVVLLLAALVAVVSPSVVLAQAPPGGPPGAPPGGAGQVPPARVTETRDDDSGKWGLLGLLGLVGLAGLLRRDRARSVTVADRPDRR
jgi:MYXO-CTERM domain-containing protein